MLLELLSSTHQRAAQNSSPISAMSSYGGRGPTVNAVLWAETAVAVVIVGMRIYTRKVILNSLGKLRTPFERIFEAFRSYLHRRLSHDRS